MLIRGLQDSQPEMSHPRRPCRYCVRSECCLESGAPCATEAKYKVANNSIYTDNCQDSCSTLNSGFNANATHVFLIDSLPGSSSLLLSMHREERPKKLKEQEGQHAGRPFYRHEPHFSARKTRSNVWSLPSGRYLYCCSEHLNTYSKSNKTNAYRPLQGSCFCKEHRMQYNDGSASTSGMSYRRQIRGELL